MLMSNKIKKGFNKISLLLLEFVLLFSPSKIMAQVQIKYGPQMAYGVMPPAQDNIILGIFQLAFLPFIILFIIFIGILMFIKRKLKSDSSRPKKTG